MNNKMKNVNRTIDCDLSDMLSDIGEIIAVPAMAPSFEGGEGELKRSKVIEKILKRSDVFDSIEHYDVIQNTETGDIVRPNIVAMVNGVDDTLPTTWIITHMDEVPTGDPKQWYSNPRKLTLAIEDGGEFQKVSFGDLDDYVGTSEFDRLVVIGRSVDDDVKPGVCAIYALKAMKVDGIKPNGNIGLVFVSDEETGGSEYGIRYLAEKIKLFSPDDLIIVPDDGNETGDVIEIAEKSRLVIKIITKGQQGHSANGYNDSKNASEVASRYQIEFADWFRNKYTAVNKLFVPSYSTIQLTQRHIESGSANTVPGTDISFIDMRLLPKYNLDDVLGYARHLAEKYQEQFKIKMTIENPVHTSAPSETSPKCEVIKKLVDAIQVVRGVKPKMIGIGGETCANHLRKIKIQGKPLNVAVYCSITGTEHKINERAKLAHILYDTKVFAHVFMN